METRGRNSLSGTGSISILFVFLALLVGGCATQSYERVPRSTAGNVQRLDHGTVVSTRDIVIDGEGGYLGQVTGGVIGSAVGQTIGKGSGRVLATAGGAAVGSVVGSAVQKELTTKQAQELTIDMDGGEVVVVIQEIQQPRFIVGDRVDVMQTRAGDARVSHSQYLFEEDGY